RQARIDRQRVGRLPDPAARGRDRARAHSSRNRRAPHRVGRGTPQQRRADGVQVARSRGRGSRRGGVCAATRGGRGCRGRGLAGIPVDQIRRAREVLEGVAIRTPLVRLDVDADAEIWLKLELLQPVRSFKIRGAGNAILQASDADLTGGVLTASAGNMAQGVAYAARLRGVPSSIVVPEHAPQTKVDAIERYGGRVIRVPYEEWWQILVTGRYEGARGMFVHPVADERVIAGNGTIGLELLEQLDGFDAVVVPYGGGGGPAGIPRAGEAQRPRR